MENILEKLVSNSKKAIEDGVYDINEQIPNSGKDLEQIITESKNASLITEVKFSSPAFGMDALDFSFRLASFDFSSSFFLEEEPSFSSKRALV